MLHVLRTKWLVVLSMMGVLAAVAAGAGARTNDPVALVVHEWGTFSSFSGSNGTNLKFYPYDNDLPDFVHKYELKGGPEGSTISLETPVLYFYADHEVSVNVHVEFPKGRFTEFYPKADWTSKKLSWENVRILPGARQELPMKPGNSRYYAARETDADPLQIAFKENDKERKEREKFLFYRGVGDFSSPLRVRALGAGRFTVVNAGKASVANVLLVRVGGGKIFFKEIGPLTGASAVTVRETDVESSVEKLGATLTASLTRAGLFEKEARAMVKTWSFAWFGEEGTRVLYILPSSTTDELLPLRIQPKPSALVRALVGRHDILTPEREQVVDRYVRQTKSPADAERQAAVKALRVLGRFEWPTRSEAELRLARRK